MRSLQLTASGFDHSTSLTSSTTSASHSKPSIIHSSNGRPRTSSRLKKPAHLVRALIQNEFTIFRSSRNSSTTTTSIALLPLQNFKIRSSKNILKSRSNAELLWRLRDRIDAIQFKIKKTIRNSHSIRLIRSQSRYNCIVDVSAAWAANATSRTVPEAIQETQYCSTWKMLILQELTLKRRTTIELLDHLQSSPNNQHAIAATSLPRRALLILSPSVVAESLAWLIAIERSVRSNVFAEFEAVSLQIFSDEIAV